MTDQTPATAAGRACDIVPGSLGGAGSIPWCRAHGRYASTCEAVAEARALDRDALADRIQEAILDLDSRQLMAEAQGYFSAEWRRWTPREIAEDIARHVAREAPAASTEEP